MTMPQADFNEVYLLLGQALGTVDDAVLFRDRLLLLALRELTLAQAHDLIARAMISKDQISRLMEAD